MLALVKAAQKADYPCEIVLVASNIPEAEGLQKAADLGVPVQALDHTPFKDRETFDRILHNRLLDCGAELICCAGFMRILTPWFVARWKDRIINIHPSLLPKYKGLNTHQRALDAGDEYHGCSVHFVTADLDSGDVIQQEKIPVSPEDTAESLARKVLKIEHPLYIRALRKVASDRLKTPSNA